MLPLPSQTKLFLKTIGQHTNMFNVCEYESILMLVDDNIYWYIINFKWIFYIYCDWN